MDEFDKYAKDEPSVFKPLRRFFKIYVRDFPGASDLRVQLMETTTTDEARAMIDAFEASHDFFKI